MEVVTAILSSTAILNIILIGTIMRIIGKLYLQIKSKTSLGMLTFLGFLLIHNILGAGAYFLVSELILIEFFPYLVGLTLSEAAGLLIYLKVSLD